MIITTARTERYLFLLVLLLLALLFFGNAIIQRGEDVWSGGGEGSYTIYISNIPSCTHSLLLSLRVLN